MTTRVERSLRCAAAVARVVVVIGVGVLLWMLGLAALDVPGDLPTLRHVIGAVLMARAVGLWGRAMSP